MPLRFGPSDLHLRTQRDGLPFGADKKGGKKKELWGKQEPKGMTKVVQSVRQQIDGAMQATGTAVAGVRDACAAGAKAVLRRVTDPLTVGGTAVVVFSLTMMMREDLLKVYVNHQQAVAAAQAERDAKTARINAIVRALLADPELHTESRRTFFVHGSSYDDTQRLYVLLEDIPPEELPAVLEQIRGRGVPVPRVLHADPDDRKSSLIELPPEKGSADARDMVGVDHVRIVVETHNRDHWDDRDAQIPWNKLPVEQSIARGISAYSSDHWDRPKSEVVVILRTWKRNTKNDGAYQPTFVDELRRHEPNSAFVYINKHPPLRYASPAPVGQIAKSTVPQQELFEEEEDD